MAKQEDCLLKDEAAMITLDGRSYAVADLPDGARDVLISLQFVQARLKQLQGELAVSQTAHVTFARVLKGELVQMNGVNRQ